MSKYVTDEAMRSAMTLQKGYIDQGDSNNTEGIDSLKAGKNLLPKVLTGGVYHAGGWGSSAEASQNPTLHEIDVTEGVFSIKEAGDNYIVSPSVRVEEGKTYTFSFYLTGGSYVIHIIGSQNNHQITRGSGGTISFTFTSVATESVSIFVGTGDKKLKMPQLELGSQYTPFTASTEELQRVIDQGDKANAEGIEFLKENKQTINLLTGVLTGGIWMGSGTTYNWGSASGVEQGMYPILHELEITEGVFSIKEAGDNYFVSPQVQVEEGKTYTFSFAFPTGGGVYDIRVIGSQNSHQKSGASGGVISFTFIPVVTEWVRIFISNGQRKLTDPQLELGSKHTQFTAPARELRAYHDKDTKELIDKVDTLLLSAQYYVAKYSKGTNDYTEISHQGQKDILNKFGFVLLDTTDNTNTTTKAKRLKDNNLFRFEDGSFAPTVGIKTAQYNQCMANDVYTEESGTYTKIYDAGAFDAAAQWEIDKALIKAGGQAKNLYISDGNGGYQLVTHVLRPWETTETKYTIGIANLVDLYLLDNQVGKSGDYWKGIFLEPIIWDGIDLSKRKLPPTAIGPCPITTIIENGLIKTRNFFYLYQGRTNCQSNQGSLPNHDFYEADRTYPNAGDIEQVTNMTYARNNNADVSKPYPFAEGGYFATNVFITALELAAGTRYIHKADMFGSGISSNDGCTAANFFTSGGCRLKKVADNDWLYRTFTQSSSPLQYNYQGYTDPMSSLLTNNWPKEQCMESQMAASMATELGINPTTDASNPIFFEFYGNKYYYMNVPGFDGLQEGKMNVRVYKYIQKTVSAYADKTRRSFDIEVIYRMSLFNGANLSGDIFTYNGGGLEMIVTREVGDSIGLPIDIYIQPDQKQWHSEITPMIKVGQKFGFEALYEKIISTTNLGSSYTLTREGYTPFRTAKASSMAQGECYFQEDTCNWVSKGYRGRIGLKSHYWSMNGVYCSPRSLEATGYILGTGGSISGSSQALIEL